MYACARGTIKKEYLGSSRILRTMGILKRKEE